MTFSDILKGKCPRCRKGDMFRVPPYDYLNFYKMHDQCPVCHQTFHPEPGFYFGAMYVSYAFSVIWVLGVSLILLVTNTFSLERVSIIIGIGIILLLPFIFQYSRILYLYGIGGIKRREIN